MNRLNLHHCVSSALVQHDAPVRGQIMHTIVTASSRPLCVCDMPRALDRHVTLVEGLTMTCHVCWHTCLWKLTMCGVCMGWSGMYARTHVIRGCHSAYAQRAHLHERLQGLHCSHVQHQWPDNGRLCIRTQACKVGTVCHRDLRYALLYTYMNRLIHAQHRYYVAASSQTWHSFFWYTYIRIQTYMPIQIFTYLAAASQTWHSFLWYTYVHIQIFTCMLTHTVGAVGAGHAAGGQKRLRTVQAGMRSRTTSIYQCSRWEAPLSLVFEVLLSYIYIYIYICINIYIYIYTHTH